MKKTIIIIFLIGAVGINLSSCTKNKLVDVNLEEHPLEEWAKMEPFDVVVAGGVGSGPATITWSMKSGYAEKIPDGIEYQINLYKDGELRFTMPSYRTSFIDNSGFQSSHTYQLSIL